MTPEFSFPCNADKFPISRHGFKDAFQGMEWRKAPLVGAPTGERNGFSVLDIDPDGFGWYAANFAALPTTRRHETPRGVHLLFRHAEGLRCSTSRIVPDVHIRAEGGYVIWWPRQGLAVDDCPIAEWPEWLLAQARGKRRSMRDLSTPLRGGVRGVEVERVTEALRKLDPVCWNGKYEEWLALMMACKFAGIEREGFIEWSIGDPDYAHDGEVIARKWESFAQPKHAGALFAALKDAGIKLRHIHHTGAAVEESAEVPLQAAYTFHPSLNRASRFVSLIDRLKKDGREDLLFWTACEIAGMVLVEGWPKPHVAKQQLTAACKRNGLLAALGDEGCQQTIENAFSHVEGKQDEKTEGC